VYLAEDTKLKRQVALKFLSAQVASDMDFKARFTREAQAAAALDHPNIVAVYKVSAYHRRPFFAMQHVACPSLRDFIHERELSINKIIDLAIHIGMS
jgi:serine/threonine protein kinase